MTSGSDDSQEKKDKVEAQANSLDVMAEIAASNNPRLALIKGSSATDFGTEKSTAITWDHVLQETGQNAKSAQPESFRNDVKKFIHLLNENRISSINWHREVTAAGTIRKPKHFANSDDTAENERNWPVFGGLNAAASSSDSVCSFTLGKAFQPTQKRYILGSEIALAVVIAAAGATRIRARLNKGDLRPELIPGDNRGDHLNRTSENRSTDQRSNLSDEKTVIEIDKTLAQNKMQKKQSAFRPKTLVASTDTLVSIAEAFFYDRNVAWLIADLNQAILKETWMDDKRIIEIKSRQQIELPLKEDIEQFYKTKAEHARPENLVTIVDQSTIDAELLNSSLGRLLHPNQEP